MAGSGTERIWVSCERQLGILEVLVKILLDEDQADAERVVLEFPRVGLELGRLEYLQHVLERTELGRKHFDEREDRSLVQRLVVLPRAPGSS